MKYNEYIQNVRSDPSFCPTTLYSLKVIDKSINAGESVLKACERHVRDLKKSLDEEQEFVLICVHCFTNLSHFC